MMEAEILNQRPISGVYEEHSFSASGNTLWVKFIDEEYLEWVGVFTQSEWSPYNKVLRLSDEKLFLVIAGGQGYFVDPNARNIVATTDWDDIRDLVHNEESGYLVATDGLRLAVLKRHELLWTGDRISLDGINFTGQSGLMVKGKLNDLTDDGCEFSFNVNTRELNAKWTFSDNWV